MSFFNKKLKVDAIHITTPIGSVSLSPVTDIEEPVCRYDAVRGNLLSFTGIAALVIPTNQYFKPGPGSLDRYAYEAAGEGLWKELKQLGSCKPGTAEVTGAYNLPYQYLIHVVGKAWDGNSVQNEDSLRQSYLSAMEKAFDYKIRSIAFPSIGTGSNGFPLLKAAGIAVKTVQGFVDAHPGCFDQIIWGMKSQETCEVYRNLLG